MNSGGTPELRNRERPVAFRFSVAIATVALATCLRLCLDPLLGSHMPFATYYLAVLVTARYCGLFPALGAILLGAFSADHYLIARGHPPLEGTALFGELLVYTFVGSSMAVIGGAMYGASRSYGREIREAGESLARTEARLALLLKSTGTSVWDWDLVTNAIRGDENAAAQFGIPHCQFPKNVEEFATHVHPGDQARIRREIAASLEQGAPYNTRFRTIWPDGSQHQLATRGKVDRDSAGRPVQFTGVCWDVTDRWRAEEELRAATQRLVAEAKFRELLEAAPDAVVVVNRQGTVVLVNAQAETLFGYARTELLGRALEELMPQRFRGRHAAYRADYVSRPYVRGKSAQLELYALRKDGLEVPVEINLSPIETEEGRLICASIRDISERKRAERSRDQLASIVDSSDDAIIGKTLEGTIVNWNHGAERLYGYRAEEIIGKSISVLIPADHADELGRIADRIRQGEVIREETVRLRKDGTLIDIALTVSPIRDSQGAITAASAITRDISQRKRAEEQIVSLNRQLKKSAAEAQAANIAKSAFLSTMSHEIRTPMNAILGYAQLMARDTSLGPDARAHLKIIGRSGEHLLALINDILDMSKIEAGRVELHQTVFNLPRLLEDLAAMFRLRAAAKALEFELHIRGESGLYVLADEGKTRQVLINLLGNAVKFTPAGRIAVEASIEARAGGQLWLSAAVSDTGPGMTEEEQAKLFEPFSQTKGALNVQQGTGLGLAISRKYARLMGGDITVRSTAGRGSTFQFEAPIARGEAGVSKTAKPSGRAWRIRPGQEPPKILVVDDHADNRAWLAALLGSLGFRLREAADGAAAVRICEEWQPELVLMDVHMPVMDGLKATQAIKAGPHGAHTIVVALTASAMNEDRRTAEQSGADDFIAKPCAEGELLEKISRHLKIVYDYDQPEPAGSAEARGTLTSDQLRSVPRDVLEQLREATSNGNKRALDQLIVGIRGHYEPTAQALQELVEHYEYDALTGLLEAACRP